MAIFEEKFRESEGLELRGFVVSHPDNEMMSPADSERLIRQLRQESPYLAEASIAPIWTASTTDPSVCPIGELTFIAHADKLQLPRARATASWRMLGLTARSFGDYPADPYPALRWTAQRPGNERIDAWSVHDRLWESRLDTKAWARGTKIKVDFLVDVINSALNPEVPLPVSRQEALRLATDPTYAPATRASRMTSLAQQVIAQTSGSSSVS